MSGWPNSSTFQVTEIDIGEHWKPLRPQNVRNRVDHLVSREELTKHGRPVARSRDRVVTRRHDERDATRGEWFRHRYRYAVSEFDVQNPTVDGFLFDEREIRDSGPNRP